MSLLQDPNKALDQIDWYLSNQQQECFPGAFLNAAGNLARQVLEQVLFILAFYSGVPKNRYIRSNNRLRTASELLAELRKTNPGSGKTYFEHARERSPRIRKFARWPRSLDKWRRLFNEPSHFRNPAAKRETKEADTREFAQRLRDILDPRDAHLVTAAFNELKSHGRIRAVIGNDAECTPGIKFDTIVSANDLVLKNGRLALQTEGQSIRVIPDNHDVPHRWPNVPVLLQHTTGISIGGRFITKHGQPVDFSSLEKLLRSLSKTETERKHLRRRLRYLGYDWPDP